MSRAEVLRKIRRAAAASGLTVEVEVEELTGHTAVTIGSARTVVSRGTGDLGQVAEAICKQLEPALGKGWWRK